LASGNSSSTSCALNVLIQNLIERGLGMHWMSASLSGGLCKSKGFVTLPSGKKQRRGAAIMPAHPASLSRLDLLDPYFGS
jgi:hypothetical protein